MLKTRGKSRRWVVAVVGVMVVGVLVMTRLCMQGSFGDSREPGAQACCSASGGERCSHQARDTSPSVIA
jgi:hypothetical protein